VGTKYSSNSTSGYNSVPPSDDGSVTEANKVKYSTIKGKLSDPVKTLADAINAELVTHFDNGPTAVTTNTTLGATHYNKVIQVSGSGVTLTLTDAATLTAGWYCDVVSTDTSNNVALARATASNTINETSADTTVYPLQSIKIMVNAAANGFLVEQKIRHVNGTLSGTTISGTIAGSLVAGYVLVPVLGVQGTHVAAVVISGDLPLAGQLAPGDWLEFAACTREEAVAVLRARREALGMPLDEGRLTTES